MSKPKSEMLTPLVFVAKNIIGPYFDAQDLSAVAQTCRKNRDTYKNHYKASKLLFYSLNINKDRKKKLQELLATQNLKDQFVILTRVNGRQVYFSKRLNKIACIRILAGVSPLEAAVLCGDFHLVQLFLDSRLVLLQGIPDNQYQEAILQLKSIRKKIESDPRSFASLIITLQKEYKELNDKNAALYADKRWGALNDLSGSIGEKQKTLPWFILQVFCRRVPHEPIPDFTPEPERECLLDDNSELDLDSIGSAPCDPLGFTNHALIKNKDRVELFVNIGYTQVGFDSAAFDSLCATIKSELDKIIKLQEQKIPLAAYPNPEQTESANTIQPNSPNTKQAFSTSSLTR